MNKYKELQSFLIRNFMKVIALVGVVEYIIIGILNVTLIPLVAHFYFEEGGLWSVGLSGIFFAAVALFISLLFRALNIIIPVAFRGLFNGLAEKLSDMAGDRLSYGSSTLRDIDVGAEIFLLLILLAMLILIVIPFVIGAIYYSHLVTKQVSILSEEEKKLHDEYESRKNLMLSDIAHDLRTPMTTVAGYAQALQDNVVDDSKKDEYLEAIQRKTGRMNELITLLFDYVRLGSEGFKLNKEK
nr:hypothetical protein [Eubacterium sp.]